MRLHSMVGMGLYTCGSSGPVPLLDIVIARIVRVAHRMVDPLNLSQYGEGNAFIGDLKYLFHEGVLAEPVGTIPMLLFS